LDPATTGTVHRLPSTTGTESARNAPETTAGPVGAPLNMYDPASPSHHLGRESGTNVQMFGYYIYNNISIGFRTFASGLLAGVGAIVVLVTNGIVIGTVAGHLTAIGYGDRREICDRR